MKQRNDKFTYLSCPNYASCYKLTNEPTKTDLIALINNIEYAEIDLFNTKASLEKILGDSITMCISKLSKRKIVIQASHNLYRFNSASSTYLADVEKIYFQYYVLNPTSQTYNARVLSYEFNPPISIDTLSSKNDKTRRGNKVNQALLACGFFSKDITPIISSYEAPYYSFEETLKAR